MAAVLQQHGADAAEKFIEEVVWRTYWKGWLEMRPSVYWRYDTERQALEHSLAEDGQRRRRHAAAVEGRTGIACFDAWVAELRDHGWLHNHTRMWFASIWVFTLGLPWQLGADFFYQHLLDADPASNTLSWRWVAGLHTQGKHYLARADNIERNTLGRFNPAGQLNDRALPLMEDAPVPAPLPIAPAAVLDDRRVALLLTEEDLHPESWRFAADVVAVAALPSLHPAAKGSPAQAFAAGALDDGCARAGRHFNVAADRLALESVAPWAQKNAMRTVVTAYAPTGPVQQQLDALAAMLGQSGIGLVRLRRDWDSLAWPAATAGFFKIKSRIPALIARTA